MRNARKLFTVADTLALLAQHVGAAQPLLPAEELAERREVLRVDAGDDAGHDRVLALAALVFLQRVHQVVRVLPGEDRVVGPKDLRAVGAVAGHAGLRGRRRRADDLFVRLHDFALQVRGDVGAFLVGKRRGLRVHGLVRAVAAGVGVEGVDQVQGVLAAELRHAVVRESILVVRDAVAAVAGIGENLAALGIAFRARIRDRRQEPDRDPAREHDCSPLHIRSRFMQGAHGTGTATSPVYCPTRFSRSEGFRSWPVSPSKIVCIRCRTCSNWCWLPPSARASWPTAPKRRWTGRTTRRRSWRCEKSPPATSALRFSKKPSDRRPKQCRRWRCPASCAPRTSDWETKRFPPGRLWQHAKWTMRLPSWGCCRLEDARSASPSC